MIPDFESDRKIIAAASPGPWEWWTSNGVKRLIAFDWQKGVMACSDIDIWEENRAFIAAARTRWPAAILEVGRLRAELAARDRTNEELQEVLEKYRDIEARHCVALDALRLAERELAAEREAARWIPVEEALPDDECELVCHGTWMRMRFRKNGKWWNEEGTEEITEVTHWRSLPKLPGEHEQPASDRA
jgi:hypothetical protein